MLPIIFAFLMLPSTVFAAKSLCPKGTYPYPEWKPNDPDSCYLFIGRRATAYWWRKLNHTTLGQVKMTAKIRGSKRKWHYMDNDRSDVGYNPQKPQNSWHDQKDLDSSVWSVVQAREICQDYHLIKNNQKEFYPVPDAENYPGIRHFELNKTEYRFRLPIIRDADENAWLYMKISEMRETMDYSIWIDLEFDIDTNRLFWASTNEYFGSGSHFESPEGEDPEWESNHIQSEDEDGMFRVCFVMMTNHGEMDFVSGWHRRACAQAYSRQATDEGCNDRGYMDLTMGLSHLMLGICKECPFTANVFRMQYAPTAVVCELPISHEEGQTHKPIPVPTTQSSRWTKTVIKKRATSSGYRTWADGVIVTWMMVANVVLLE